MTDDDTVPGKFDFLFRRRFYEVYDTTNVKTRVDFEERHY